MKQLILAVLGTSVAWGLAGWLVLQNHLYYLISANDMNSLAEQYSQVYNAGFHAYQALLKCEKDRSI